MRLIRCYRGKIGVYHRFCDEVSTNGARSMKAKTNPATSAVLAAAETAATLTKAGVQGVVYATAGPAALGCPGAKAANIAAKAVSAELSSGIHQARDLRVGK